MFFVERTVRVSTYVHKVMLDDVDFTRSITGVRMSSDYVKVHGRHTEGGHLPRLWSVLIWEPVESAVGMLSGLSCPQLCSGY